MSSGSMVTVLMPVRNGGRTLREAVQSIRLQTYADWELLVLDDGSNDGALADVAQLRDPRIRIVPGERPLGIAARLNQGIAMAKGVLVARMDADDVSFPQRLERQVALLEAHRRVDLVGTSAVLMDEVGDLTGYYPRALTHAALCARPWRGFHLAHPGWMGRIEWFRAHLYAESGVEGCEDQELLLRTYADSRFACTPDVLLAYRVRSHLDWRRLYRTRHAWWACQRRHFSAGGQLHLLALAAGCHALRLVRDAWLCWRGRTLFQVDPVAPALLREWADLQGRLREGREETLTPDRCA